VSKALSLPKFSSGLRLLVLEEIAFFQKFIIVNGGINIELQFFFAKIK